VLWSGLCSLCVVEGHRFVSYIAIMLPSINKDVTYLLESYYASTRLNAFNLYLCNAFSLYIMNIPRDNCNSWFTQKLYVGPYTKRKIQVKVG